MKSALRPYVTAGAALAGASIIAIAPVAPPPPGSQLRAVQLSANEALIMGGSGTPIPPVGYMDAVTDRYINATLPGLPFPAQPQAPDLGGAAERIAQPVFFPGSTENPLFTPEGLEPLFSGIKSLPLDTSVAQGRQILDSTVLNQIAAGNNVTVYGESQSATISSLSMTDLANGNAGPDFGPSTPVPADQLAFVLTGDPSNPDGGILERFDGLTIPSLQITFSGATPADTPYDTAIYTQEYDGFADFPRYPIDLLSDLNAELGTILVHPFYPSLTAEQISTAIQLPVSAGYTGNTDYFLIPHEGLPLLEPVRDIPVIGKPLADLLQPILTPLVNVGYGDPDFGWSTGPADVPTPFGVLPSSDMLLKTFEEMVTGIPTGLKAAAADLGTMLSDPGAMSLGSDSLPDLSSLNFTDIVNALTGAFADLYATLLPTADVATALTVTLPTYDADFFLNGLQAGDLLDAFGKPAALDVGLGSFAVLVEFDVLESAITDAIDEFNGLF
jgi:hypothetical protein